MQPRYRIGPGVAVDLRQVPDGSAGGDHAVARSQGLDARTLDRLPYLPRQRVDLLRGRGVGGQEGVGDAQGAQRERSGGDGAAPVERGELDAAAAEVHHHPVLHGQARHRTPERQQRLPVTVDHRELDPRAPPDRLDQVGGVRGLPRRRGGHGQDAFGPRALGECPEVPENRDGPDDRRFGEASVMAEVQGQTERRAAVGDGLQVPAGCRPQDHDPPGVRPHVHHGDRTHRRRRSIRR